MPTPQGAVAKMNWEGQENNWGVEPPDNSHTVYRMLVYSALLQSLTNATTLTKTSSLGVPNKLQRSDSNQARTLETKDLIRRPPVPQIILTELKLLYKRYVTTVL